MKMNWPMYWIGWFFAFIFLPIILPDSLMWLQFTIQGAFLIAVFVILGLSWRAKDKEAKALEAAAEQERKERQIELEAPKIDALIDEYDLPTPKWSEMNREFKNG